MGEWVPDFDDKGKEKPKRKYVPATSIDDLDNRLRGINEALDGIMDTLADLHITVVIDKTAGQELEREAIEKKYRTRGY